MEVTKKDNHLIIDLPLDENRNLNGNEVSLAIIEIIGNTSDRDISNSEIEQICMNALKVFGILKEI